jgi:hypothetical protein
LANLNKSLKHETEKLKTQELFLQKIQLLDKNMANSRSALKDPSDHIIKHDTNNYLKELNTSKFLAPPIMRMYSMVFLIITHEITP